jgi:hypothetical protein
MELQLMGCASEELTVSPIGHVLELERALELRFLGEKATPGHKPEPDHHQSGDDQGHEEL